MEEMSMFLWMKVWLFRYFWRPKPKEPTQVESTSNKTSLERIQDWRHKRHNTALLNAANAGQVWKAEQLVLREGADLNCLSRDGETPLLLAIHQGQESMVKFLMELGASAEAVANGRERYLNKGRDTNDPLKRAIISGLPAEPTQAIIRRYKNLKRLKKALRLLKQEPYGPEVERAELVEMALVKRIDELRGVAASAPTSNVTSITASTLPKL